MRPQQNRRMRGRGGGNNNNNQNRKGPNPLTRSYESNGPDVKIRGTAQQIAEKYATLARDAQSSGDRVMAENYLQHAEHYNRIIMAAQAQMPQQPVRDARDEDEMDEDGEDGFAQAASDRTGQQHRANGSGPQPVIEGTPAEVALTQDAVAETGSPADAVAADAPAPEGEAEEGASRRPRRPRRARGKAGGDAAASDEQPSSDEEPVTEAAQ